MHRPGYVQGGQEANRGYLLLGVYHRRIPGDTIGLPALSSCDCLFLFRPTIQVLFPGQVYVHAEAKMLSRWNLTPPPLLLLPLSHASGFLFSYIEGPINLNPGCHKEKFLPVHGIFGPFWVLTARFRNHFFAFFLGGGGKHNILFVP